ncbi:hypothetical protein PV08_08783 [Exophiala spinifera]|uniref:Uncharacterized protein n=1 Tax=Exophiala spinifera TaxID=91928 RepID=A0A0D2BQY8_9EURO|nr:uncharacterized protein PV08_08783 [Exophiala spinifera]KIW13594.1 hypothetical protein PV08_08783 [Exophiala spinifera]
MNVMLSSSGLCSQSGLRLFFKHGCTRLASFPPHTPPTEQYGKGASLFSAYPSKRQIKPFSLKRGPMLYRQSLSRPSQSSNKSPSSPTEKAVDAAAAAGAKKPTSPEKDDGSNPSERTEYSINTMDDLATEVHKISQEIRLRSVNELREVLSDRENTATISEVLTAAQLQARIDIKDELTKLKDRTSPDLHWRLDQVMRTADNVHISHIRRIPNLPLLVLWHGAKFVLRRPILAALILLVLLTSSMFGAPIN